MNQAKLYLIPSLIAECEPLEVLPLSIRKIIESTSFYVVENEKSARHFVKKAHPAINQGTLHISLLNKFTNSNELMPMLQPCLQGQNVGLISEAGCPGVADPGAELVALAHQQGIQVVPLVGPSAILLALMASGMNGQNFAFVGYLPIDKGEKKKRLKDLERLSQQNGQTQIFIETPYRNHKLFQELLSVLAPATKICVASNITGDNEFILTQTVAKWRNTLPDLGKEPAIFLIDARL